MICGFLLSLFGVVLRASPAEASLKVCNQTGGRLAIALGHNDTTQWLSEGWWQIDAHKCAVLIEGPLSARYYYIYALDHDAPAQWTGDVFMCTAPNAFTIEGKHDCRKRGFARAGFREIDTGEYGDWTEYLAALPKL